MIANGRMSGDPIRPGMEQIAAVEKTQDIA